MIRLKTVTSSDDSYLNKKHSILVIGVFKNQKLDSTQNQLNKKLDDLIINTIKLEGFKGECDQSLMCYGGGQFQRILIVGLGAIKEYSADIARDLGSKTYHSIKKIKINKFSIDGNSFNLNKKSFAQSFTEGLILGSYSFDDYKTENKKQDYLNCTIYGEINHDEVTQGAALGNSVAFARDLGNHPANILTPTYLAKSSQDIAKKTTNMKSTVFDLKDIKKMGMGAFYGVAKGAKEPAKMIIVEYSGGKTNERPIALVGKGLTFDSGGISIKPSPKMDEMKFDMCGSATVLGVMKAVSILKPKINIVFAIGSTENMPGSDAQKPGDIVTAYNGKTIEVLNTDAEGRLVLADVLSYVNKKYKPNSIIDFATLTGAVLIALGNRASGVMGNDKDLMNEVIEASGATSEKVWELPLWEEYTREIKGKYADIQNIGQARLAGTITAGAFLKEFVADTPWVHMDIAGTAWGPSEPSYQPKVGATGVAVRLVYNLLENRL